MAATLTQERFAGPEWIFELKFDGVRLLAFRKEADVRLLSQEFSKADRRGRILVDTGRNAYSATFAAVYAVRPKRGAPVSAPCTWDEVECGAAGPRTFTLRNIEKRLVEVGDLWGEMLAEGQSLRSAIELLKGLP